MPPFEPGAGNAPLTRVTEINRLHSQPAARAALPGLHNWRASVRKVRSASPHYMLKMSLLVLHQPRAAGREHQCATVRLNTLPLMVRSCQKSESATESSCLHLDYRADIIGWDQTLSEQSTARPRRGRRETPAGT